MKSALCCLLGDVQYRLENFNGSFRTCGPFRLEWLDWPWNETIGLLSGSLKWKGRFFFIDRRAIPDAMCWRHHDSDISDPAPKDGFDEADVITLTHQPIDIRGIPSGLLFSAGLAITWEFPKFRPLFKDPEGNVSTSSFSFWNDYRGWGGLDRTKPSSQHTTTPLSADEQVPDKTDSQQRVEASDPKIVATRIRKANAAAKRKADKNRELEGAGGSEGSSKRRKEKSSDHIPCPTPLRTIVAVASDVSRGDNVISPTQTQGDNLLEIPAHDSANTTTRLYEEHHDEHSGFWYRKWKRVVIETESIPTAATRPDNRKSIAQEETPMPEPLPISVVSFEVLVPDGRVFFTHSLLVRLVGIFFPPEESLEPGSLGPVVIWHGPHPFVSFAVLYDTIHAIARGGESRDYARQLREEHAQCSEGLAVVRAERDSLMAYNAIHALRIKDPGKAPCSKDSAWFMLKGFDERTLRKLESHEYKQSLSVPFNFALQTGWGQGLAEERSEKELHKIMMRMNGFDPYSDKKMTAEYERLFSKTYPYVDRISHLSEKPVQDLLKLHPAPPPKDAPKTGSGGIAFAPKLVRAAEVAGSKDIASKEFSRSKTGPSLQDPASKHASGGSKAPPSKKT
ncbi:hypothetical protein Tco_0761657 [Tanacetum coccineum]